MCNLKTNEALKIDSIVLSNTFKLHFTLILFYWLLMLCKQKLDANVSQSMILNGHVK